MATEVIKRLHWNKDQKRKIIDEAIRIRLLDPEIPNLQLIRQAQKILPVEEQRNLKTVGWAAAFSWFLEGIEAAQERLLREGAEEEEPTPEVVPEPVQEPEKPAEPVPVQDVVAEPVKAPEKPAEPPAPPTTGILSVFSQILEEMRLSRDMEVTRLRLFQQQMDRLEARLDARPPGRGPSIFESGFTITVAPLGGVAPQVRELPAREQPVVHEQPVNVHEQPVNVHPPAQKLRIGQLQRLQENGSQVQEPEVPRVVVSPPPPPLKPPAQFRKPRVMVLNTDSGHVRFGIQKGAQGFVAKLGFDDTSGLKTPDFKEYDYILAYKKTPHAWLEVAKKFYERGKFFAVSGGALKVVDKIKVLPPIEVKEPAGSVS